MTRKDKQLFMRLWDAQMLLHIHSMLSDAEQAKVQARIRKKTARLQAVHSVRGNMAKRKNTY